MCASVIVIAPTEGSSLVWHRDDVDRQTVEGFLRAVQSSETLRELEYPYSGSKDPGCARIHRNISLAGKHIASISLLRHRGVPFAPHEERVLQRLGRLVSLAWLEQRSRNQEIDLTRLRERQAIADDLHDRVAQILFAAQLGLDSALEQDGLDDQVQSRVVEIRALLAKGEAVIRDVIHRLAPASVDVRQQLYAEIRDLEEEFDTEVEVQIATQAADAVLASDEAVMSCVLRVAREGTMNAIKHSGASRISVRLDSTATGAVTLAVTDDGCGIPEGQDEGYGMTSLRRATAAVGGDLRFESNPTGRGTCVSLTLNAEAAREG